MVIWSEIAKVDLRAIYDLFPTNHDITQKKLFKILGIRLISYVHCPTWDAQCRKWMIKIYERYHSTLIVLFTN